MSLIEQIGTQAQAEIVASKANTKAFLPNCYVPKFEAYGYACTYSRALFVFDEAANCYMPYMPLNEAQGECVMIEDLLAELRIEKGLVAA